MAGGRVKASVLVQPVECVKVAEMWVWKLHHCA